MPSTNSHVSIVEQIQRIGDKRNRTAFTIGGIIGAFVPVAVYTLSTHVMGDAGSHVDLVAAWNVSLENKMLLILILAGGVFSAKSVFGWGSSAFAGDRLKALGFCILIEGIMVLSPIAWLRVFAAAFLLVINSIATGANLMVESSGQDAGEVPESSTVKDSLIVATQCHHSTRENEIRNSPPVFESRSPKRTKTTQAKRREKVCKMLKENPAVTVPEIARRLSVTERTASTYRAAAKQKQPSSRTATASIENAE